MVGFVGKGGVEAKPVAQHQRAGCGAFPLGSAGDLKISDLVIAQVLEPRILVSSQGKLGVGTVGEGDSVVGHSDDGGAKDYGPDVYYSPLTG